MEEAALRISFSLTLKQTLVVERESFLAGGAFATRNAPCPLYANWRSHQIKQSACSTPRKPY